MAFTKNFTINSLEQLHEARAKLDEGLKASSLSDGDRALLGEQISTVLETYETLLSQNEKKSSITAERVLEGSGYSVSLRLAPRKKGLLARLAGSFR